MSVLASQLDLLNHIKNFVVNSIDKVGLAKRTKSHFKARLTLLEKYWTTFYNNHAILCKEYDTLKEEKYFVDGLFTVGGLVYSEALATITDEIEKLDKLNATQDNSGQGRPASQPTRNRSLNIDVPVFDGNQKSWDEFKSLFTAVCIDVTDCPPAVKFTQLLTHTSGPAKTAIQGLPIESGSFHLGWNKLLRRYDGNNRRLYSYLEGFLQLPAVKKKIRGAAKPFSRQGRRTRKRP